MKVGQCIEDEINSFFVNEQFWTLSNRGKLHIHIKVAEFEGEPKKLFHICLVEKLPPISKMPAAPSLPDYRDFCQVSTDS